MTTHKSGISDAHIPYNYDVEKFGGTEEGRKEGRRKRTNGGGMGGVNI